MSDLLRVYKKMYGDDRLAELLVEYEYDVKHPLIHDQHHYTTEARGRCWLCVTEHENRVQLSKIKELMTNKILGDII